MDNQTHGPTFRPMVEACREYGIGRSLAYELAKEGLLETFCIRSKRMVMMASLQSLPERLAKAAKDDAA